MVDSMGFEGTDKVVNSREVQDVEFLYLGVVRPLHRSVSDISGEDVMHTVLVLKVNDQVLSYLSPCTCHQDATSGGLSQHLAQHYNHGRDVDSCRLQHRESLILEALGTAEADVSDPSLAYRVEVGSVGGGCRAGSVAEGWKLHRTHSKRNISQFPLRRQVVFSRTRSESRLQTMSGHESSAFLPTSEGAWLVGSGRRVVRTIGTEGLGPGTVTEGRGSSVESGAQVKQQVWGLRAQGREAASLREALRDSDWCLSHSILPGQIEMGYIWLVDHAV